MPRSVLLILILSVAATACTTAPRPAVESCPELAGLSPAARAEVLAIARIFAMKPRYALDFTRVGMHALSVGHDTMVTFAADPTTTKEDVIFFIPAKRLIRAGLDSKKFETLPPPGKMESGKWYFSSGREADARFNKNAIGIPVLMMAVDTETP